MDLKELQHFLDTEMNEIHNYEQKSLEVLDRLGKGNPYFGNISTESAFRDTTMQSIADNIKRFILTNNSKYRNVSLLKLARLDVRGLKTNTTKHFYDLKDIEAISKELELYVRPYPKSVTNIDLLEDLKKLNYKNLAMSDSFGVIALVAALLFAMPILCTPIVTILILLNVFDSADRGDRVRNKLINAPIHTIVNTLFLSLYYIAFGEEATKKIANKYKDKMVDNKDVNALYDHFNKIYGRANELLSKRKDTLVEYKDKLKIVAQVKNDTFKYQNLAATHKVDSVDVVTFIAKFMKSNNVFIQDINALRALDSLYATAILFKEIVYTHTKVLNNLIEDMEDM